MISIFQFVFLIGQQKQDSSFEDSLKKLVDKSVLEIKCPIFF